MLSEDRAEYKRSKGIDQVLDNPKIMVVDDNIEYLEEIEEVLFHGGYEVETVPDSGRALALAHEHKPRLILMDLKMSPKNGFQVADELRHSLLMKDVPIIAMTGFFTEKEHILMMKLCGIKSFLLKPVNPINLIAKIEFALGHRSEEYDA